MIFYLQQWFKQGNNVGKSFKQAYRALIKEFEERTTPVKVSMHGCYKAFQRYGNYSYKRIQRVKIKSNTESNKMKRLQFLQNFIPYHRAEGLAKCEIIFIDEAGFNLDKQGTNYAWGDIGK